MSSNDIAVSVRGLSKSYTISHDNEKHVTMAESLLHSLKNPFQRAEKETFWALKDVDFDIKKGDVVGIIGRNGAGKSTLLKILSRITEPTSGEIKLYGRVGSLLEVGTGFHPELTGRENIYLNGAILGMSRSEITKQFDAIVDFSGTEKFLDTPVKRYSSGMYVRLAFAVAAHLNPEILIIDEVLAVGDAEFQRKCLGKMKDVAESGRTVLFVSHHMQSVKVLCGKSMYLEHGQINFLGDVQGGIMKYLESFDKFQKSTISVDRRPGTGEFRFSSVTTNKEYYSCSEEKIIRFTILRIKHYSGNYFISCHVVDEFGVILLQCDSRLLGYWISASDQYEGQFVLRTPWLKPGIYRIDIFICNAGIFDNFEDACRLNVIPLFPYPACADDDMLAVGTSLADFTFTSSSEIRHSREMSIL